VLLAGKINPLNILGKIVGKRTDSGVRAKIVPTNTWIKT
jgi:hypothetical protein